MSGPRSTPFSILLSLYSSSKIDDFQRCLDSVAVQTRQPAELVAVFDGPVSDDIYKVLDRFETETSAVVKRVVFSENRGLGPALADGLAACTHDLVARVDTDDVCLQNRFSIQIACLEDDPDLDVVGGWMEEKFTDAGGQLHTLVRRVPVNTTDIVRSSRYRNPLNHPTVVLRRQRAMDAGNYQPMLWFEDYFLWTRMIQRGYRITNIPEVLVTTMTSSVYFDRRGGRKYLRQELALAKELRTTGFHNRWHSLRFIATRSLFRIVPLSARSWLYTRALRRRHIESV